MTDIEDLKPTNNEYNEHNEYNEYNTSKLDNRDNGDIGDIENSEFVYIKTWGCSHNWSDSEYMAGILIKNGYRVTFKEDESLDANIWILNSCTVKGRAQNLFESALKKAKELNKFIVSAGCVPSGDKKNELWSDVSIIGVQQIDQINYVVKQTLNGNIVKLLKNKKVTNQINERNEKNEMNEVRDKKKTTRKGGGAPLSMPKLRRNKYEEIIPINTGCLNQCTYCKTKHARGDLGSYEIQEIIDRIKEVLSNDDVRIINLESEDTGAYGIDIGTNIAELLFEIEKQILNDPLLSRNMMLRLGISNPPYFLTHASKVAKIINHPKVFKYMHIPVQSGANKVLYDMKRKYTIQEFEQLCQIMIDELQDIHLCTDIIAGFPTETNQHWEKTVNLVKKWKFTTMYISPFFPRPGTPAANFDYVYGDNDRVNIDRIKKERVKQLTNLYNKFEPFNKRLNTKQFWICHKGLAKDGIHYIGLNEYAEKILIKPCLNKNGEEIDLSGKILYVYVNQCGKKYMYGKVCNDYIDLLQQYPNEINYIQLKKEKSTEKHKYYTIIILIVALLIYQVFYQYFV